MCLHARVLCKMRLYSVFRVRPVRKWDFDVHWGNANPRRQNRSDTIPTMTRSTRCCAAIFLFTFCAAAQQSKVESVLNMPEFIQDWKVSKQFTLDVANAMPAEYYSFKPNPEEMSFGQQVVHIAVANLYRFHEITNIEPPFQPRRDLPSDKASAIRMLGQSFDYVLAALPQVTPEQLQRTWNVGWKGRPVADGRTMMMNMFVHVAHHRAQCEVYLRVKGIKPPDYTF